MSTVVIKSKRREMLLSSDSLPTLLIPSSSTIYIPQIIQEIMTLGGGITISQPRTAFTVTAPIRRKYLVELELSRLMTYTHSITTDPERFKRLVELVGDKNEVLHILWLVNMPFDALSEGYRDIELQLYRLARYRNDVHVVILDATRHQNTVEGIMNALGLTELPALIISEKPIDLEEPSADGTVVLRKGAIDRLIEQGKIQDFLANLPIWAVKGNLRSKAKLEGIVKPLLRELWDELIKKGLIKLNIPA